MITFVVAGFFAVGAGVGAVLVRLRWRLVFGAAVVAYAALAVGLVLAGQAEGGMEGLGYIVSMTVMVAPAAVGHLAGGVWIWWWQNQRR